MGRQEAAAVDTLNTGWTPRVLRAIGLPALQLTVDQSVLNKVRERHGLTIANLQRLPAMLADPLMVHRSTTEPNAVLVIDKIGNKTLAAAVHLNRQNQRIYINAIASIYERSARELRDAIEGKGILYLDQKNAPSTLASLTGVQFPGVAELKERNPKIRLRSDFVKQ